MTSHAKQPESQPRKRTWYRRSAAAFRWVHIYISMLGFASLMFFAFTGLTLNHPTWFGAAEQSVSDLVGQLPEAFLNSNNDVSENVEEATDKLGIAEWLRSEHRLKGYVADFSVDEFEHMVVFKGPGYSADVFIDRDSGRYSLTETTTGPMAVMNDLHKGRDSGTQWSWVIDVSAIITMLMSLSGFGLLFYIRRRRISGVATAVAGTVALVVVWAFWVP